jgi:hypothetical protein
LFGPSKSLAIVIVGNADHGPGLQLALEPVVAALALREPQPPAVVVDDDRDVVRVLPGRGALGVGGLVEVPLRRGELPDELVELVGVLRVALLAAVGGEVVLVPPAELGWWYQRLLVGDDVDDQEPLTDTSAVTRSGHSAATMYAVRAPQSKPPSVAVRILRASLTSLQAGAGRFAPRGLSFLLHCPLPTRFHGEGRS